MAGREARGGRDRCKNLIKSGPVRAPPVYVDGRARLNYKGGKNRAPEAGPTHSADRARRARLSALFRPSEVRRIYEGEGLQSRRSPGAIGPRGIYRFSC